MTGALVIDLEDAAALDTALTGGKAAALARALAAGCRTMPGTVLTTAFCEEIDEGADVEAHPAVDDAFDAHEG